MLRLRPGQPCGRVQDLQVGLVGIRDAPIVSQLLVEPYVSRRGEEGAAVPVMGKGAGFADHGLDEITPVDAVLLTVGPRHAADRLVAVVQLDALEGHPAAEAFADGRRRHRVDMLVDGHQRARVHAAGELAVSGQGAARDTVQVRQFSVPGRAACRVTLVEQLHEKVAVLLHGPEVAAAAEQQRSVQALEEVAMSAFDIAVLVRAADVDGACLQPAAVQQGLVVNVEYAALAVTDPVRHRAAVVGLHPVGQPAGSVCRLAQHRLQRKEVLRSAEDRPLPVREGKDRVTEAVLEELASDGHAQFGGDHPVDLKPLARLVDLVEEHLLGHVTRTPGAEPTLQRAQLTVAEAPGPEPLQMPQGGGGPNMVVL